MSGHGMESCAYQGDPSPGSDVEDMAQSGCATQSNLPSQPKLSLTQTCKLVCEASFNPVLVCSEEKLWGCSSRLLEMLGYSSEKAFLQFTTPQILERHFYPRSVFENGIARPARVKDVCRVYAGPPGSSQKLAVRAKPWELEDGHLLYTISICETVPQFKPEGDPLQENAPLPPGNSSQRQPVSFLSEIPAQRSQPLQLEPPTLPASELLYREILLISDSLPFLIWYLGPSGELTYMNRLYKERPSAGNPSRCDDHVKMMSRWNSCMENQTSFSMEVRLRYHPGKPLPPGRDREYRWFSLSVVSLAHFGKTSLATWVCSAIDINDLKVAQEERARYEASEKAAVDASRLKSDFLAMMSHEIRTPLFGVVGNTCLVKETALDKEQMELVDSIELSGKLLMTVIQDVLDFSRIESGRMMIQRNPFKLELLATHIGKMLKMEASKKGLELKATYSDFSGNLLGDSGRLLQVLTNLTSNAIKFTQRGSVHLSANLHVEPNSEGMLHHATLAVQVVDTGIGISEESIPTLFTPWTQADVTRRRTYGGSGLGLSICKSLISLMNGKIGLESKLGKGTTVWFSVPLEVEPAAPSALDLPTVTIIFSQQTKQTNPPSPLLRKAKRRAETPLTATAPPLTPKRYRVLVAEDNPVNQAILARFLDKMGDIEYVMISDGQVALDAYLARGAGYYDIILLDQSLPGMNGDEVCRRIRSCDGDQILISVSANALLADQVRFLELGMNDSLSKPVTYDRFRQVLSLWLARGYAFRKPLP
ncbi:hypothetical protein L0F63_002955 [Massospora cicadina]|nr:hypothetical protein L0F63_002955 [Massospora cicadina]